MFVLVVGGGKVGYYLAKELIEAGHEVALMEKDPGRARSIADEIGSIVIAARRLRGQVPRRGRREPGRRRGGGDRRRRGQPRHLPDGQAPLRRPAHDRPRQQPQERGALPPPRRRRAHQPHPDDPGLHRAGHPGPRAAPPRGPRRERARAHRGAPAVRLARHRQGARATWPSRTAVRCSRSSATGSRRRSGPTRSCSRATRSSPSASRSARTSSTTSSSATRRSRSRPAPDPAAAGRGGHRVSTAQFAQHS